MHRLHYAFSAIALTLAIVTLGPRESFGQEAAASLHGRVVDAAGRGVAGVTVTAQSANLAGPLITHTTASGSYGLNALPPGAYVITFASAGLVTVKQSMRLSPAESAVVRVVMRPENGSDGAITVKQEQQVYPASWATSLFSRHSSLEWLPVTGTARSVTGLVTEYPGVRPDASLFLVDGIPLRFGWNAGLASFAGPGPETIQEVSVSPGRLPAGYGRLEAGAIEMVTSRGAYPLAGSFRASFDGADINGDRLQEARETDGLSGSAEYTFGGALVRDHIWFFASGRDLTQTVPYHTANFGTPFETKTRERLGIGKVTLAANARHRLEAQWLGVQQRLTNAVPAGSLLVGDTSALESRDVSDRALSAAYVGRFGRELDLAVRFTSERGREHLESTSNTLRVTASASLGPHYVTAGYDVARISLFADSFRLRDQAFFVTDRWLAADRLTFDLGMRVDRSRGATEPSPRLFATWRPAERRPWVLNAGLGHYVIDPFNNSLDTFALLIPQATTDLPHVDEWSFGVSRELGQPGHARVDFTRRVYGDLPGQLDREYSGLTLRAKYRFGHYADVDAQYTFSQLDGDFSAPLTAGSLPDDARHRFRIWAHTELMAHDSRGLLVFTTVLSRESTRSFGVVRLESLSRTDFGLSYRRRLPGTIHGDLFSALHILNVFDKTAPTVVPVTTTLPRSLRLVVGIRF